MILRVLIFISLSFAGTAFTQANLCSALIEGQNRPLEIFEYYREQNRLGNSPVEIPDFRNMPAEQVLALTDSQLSRLNKDLIPIERIFTEENKPKLEAVLKRIHRLQSHETLHKYDVQYFLSDVYAILRQNKPSFFRRYVLDYNFREAYQRRIKIELATNGLTKTFVKFGFIRSEAGLRSWLSYFKVRPDSYFLPLNLGLNYATKTVTGFYFGPPELHTADFRRLSPVVTNVLETQGVDAAIKTAEHELRWSLRFDRFWHVSRIMVLSLLTYQGAVQMVAHYPQMAAMAKLYWIANSNGGEIKIEADQGKKIYFDGWVESIRETEKREPTEQEIRQKWEQINSLPPEFFTTS